MESGEIQIQIQIQSHSQFLLFRIHPWPPNEAPSGTGFRQHPLPLKSYSLSTLGGALVALDPGRRLRLRLQKTPLSGFHPAVKVRKRCTFPPTCTNRCPPLQKGQRRNIMIRGGTINSSSPITTIQCYSCHDHRFNV